MIKLLIKIGGTEELTLQEQVDKLNALVKPLGAAIHKSLDVLPGVKNNMPVFYQEVLDNAQSNLDQIYQDVCKILDPIIEEKERS